MQAGLGAGEAEGGRPAWGNEALRLEGKVSHFPPVHKPRVFPQHLLLVAGGPGLVGVEVGRSSAALEVGRRGSAAQGVRLLVKWAAGGEDSSFSITPPPHGEAAQQGAHG